MSGSLFRRIAGAAVSVVAFFAGLVATAGLITSRVPERFVPLLTPKLDYLAETRGKYDALLVGSSRLFHHLNPPIFDAALRQRGVELHTFNLALEGMRPPETFYTLRRALNLGLPLRYVLLELWDIDTRIAPDFATVVRVVHWHDPHHTWVALRHTISTRDALPEKCVQLWIQARAFAQRNTSIGRGAELLQPMLAVKKPWQEPRPWEGSDGFLPGPPRVMPAAEEACFLKAVTRARERGLPPRRIAPELAEELRDLAGKVRAAGARLVLVIPPSVEPGDGSPDLRALGIDADLIAFNEPAKTPALFDPVLHTDGRHLNARGAELFSSECAADFARLIEEKR